MYNLFIIYCKIVGPNYYFIVRYKSLFKLFINLTGVKVPTTVQTKTHLNWVNSGPPYIIAKHSNSVVL